MIDRILQLYCVYLCIYVNDIVIYSTILSKHLCHLQYMFSELIFKKICLFSEKFFLNYSSIQLLRQQVNVLELVTAKDKLVIITNLEFSYTFIQFKKYLDLIDYLWQYILHYTVIVKSLQLHKMLLNQWIQQNYSIENKNKQKRIISYINMNESTLKKLNVFHHLQTLFARLLILSHFDSKQQLYINLDALKKFDFKVHIYHEKSI